MKYCMSLFSDGLKKLIFRTEPLIGPMYSLTCGAVRTGVARAAAGCALAGSFTIPVSSDGGCAGIGVPNARATRAAYGSASKGAAATPGTVGDGCRGRSVRHTSVAPIGH